MIAPNVDRITTRGSPSQRALDWLVCVPVPLACAAVLGWLTGTSGVELAIIFGVFLAAAVVALAMTRRPAHVDSSPAKNSSFDRSGAMSTSRVSEALDALRALPNRRQRVFLLAGLAPGIVVPTLLSLIGQGDWLDLARLRSLVVVSLVTASLSSSMMFFWTRRALAPARAAIANSAAGAAALAVLADGTAPTARLAVRLQLAIAIPAIAGLILVVDVAAHEVRGRAEATALVWVESVVESIARIDSSRPLRERIEQALPREELWPVSTRTFAVSPGTVDGLAQAESSAAFVSELDRQLARESNGGLIVPGRGPEIGAFRKLENGEVVIARVTRADLVDGSGGLGGPVFVAVLGMGLVSILFGTIVSREFERSLDGLRQGALSLSSGDLRSRPFDPSDDEFGELAHSLSVVGHRFRMMLERTSQAAARVDQTLENVSHEMASIATASADQALQVEQANRLMSAIRGQVGAASRSADELTHAIDESSHSVVELGATGDELNETASLLTAKVDAVSDSLEQMVASVKQVGATTERLAQASEETSSSMEEMASAMRAVDTAAASTANLSRAVVDKAELGQAKVVQTIAGMEAIREATDVAERVIRGLGARTNEIGGILDVIEDVADETNLLALNAAIIAAQAGDQGRAFSVVADEIKELADRVLASTKEIGGLIRAVQDESENAIGAIEAGSASVMSGVDLSAEAGRTLEEITEASRESGTRISEIVNSVREQTKAASHVVALMERVRESTDQIGAAGAEQERGNDVVYRMARTMREVAEQVRRTTEGQAAGFGRIRENVIGVRGAVEQITGVLREQSDVCTQVGGFLEGVAAGSRVNEGATAGVQTAIAELAAEADGLREDIKRFRC